MGKLIAFEGIDRAGKSSSVRALADLFGRGARTVATFHFPYADSVTGRVLSDYLAQPAAALQPDVLHLLFSANRGEQQDALRAALATHDYVFVDRYVGSGTAYSVANGLDMEWCQTVDANLLQPDATLYFNIAPELAAARPGFGEQSTETLAFQQQVHDAYAYLFAANNTWYGVDIGADTAPEQVNDQLFTIICTLYERRGHDWLLPLAAGMCM